MAIIFQLQYFHSFKKKRKIMYVYKWYTVRNSSFWTCLLQYGVIEPQDWNTAGRCKTHKNKNKKTQKEKTNTCTPSYQTRSSLTIKLSKLLFRPAPLGQRPSKTSDLLKQRVISGRQMCTLVCSCSWMHAVFDMCNAVLDREVDQVLDKTAFH